MNISRLLVLLIAITGLGSSFLPWVDKTSWDSSGFSRSYSGLDQGDALATLIFCLISGLVAITGKRKSRLNRPKKWTIVISGLLIIASCYWSASFMRETNDFNARINLSLVSMPAIGFWIGCIIGCLLFIVPLIIRGKDVESGKQNNSLDSSR